MDKKIGLNLDEISKIQNIFLKHFAVKKVVIYGSRARGDNKKYSDVDLCIIHHKPIEIIIISQIKEDLDNIQIPYFVHVIEFVNIKNEKLKNNIINEGIYILDLN